MVTRDEMVQKIKEIFNLTDEFDGPLNYNDYQINFLVDGFFLSDKKLNVVYRSSAYPGDDYTQYLDDLIIFKELILPKYL